MVSPLCDIFIVVKRRVNFTRHIFTFDTITSGKNYVPLGGYEPYPRLEVISVEIFKRSLKKFLSRGIPNICGRKDKAVRSIISRTSAGLFINVKRRDLLFLSTSYSSDTGMHHERDHPDLDVRISTNVTYTYS